MSPILTNTSGIPTVRKSTVASAPPTDDWEFFVTNNTGGSLSIGGMQLDQNAGASMVYVSATAVNPPMNLGVIAVDGAAGQIIIFDFGGASYPVAATTQVKVLTIVMSDTSSDIPNASTTLQMGATTYTVATRVNGVTTNGNPATAQFTADYIQL
jgi:hypothetical protein